MKDPMVGASALGRAGAGVLGAADGRPGATVELDEPPAVGGPLAPDVLRGGHVVGGPVVDLLQRVDERGPTQLAPELDRLLDEQPGRGPGEDAEEGRRGAGA